MSTHQFKVQMGKSTLIMSSIKQKCQLWREINTSPAIFFLQGPNLSTEIVRVQSVRNRRQSGYSRANTKNNKIKKGQADFP